MSLDRRMKPDHLERIHAATGRTCKLYNFIHIITIIMFYFKSSRTRQDYIQLLDLTNGWITDRNVNWDNTSISWNTLYGTPYYCISQKWRPWEVIQLETNVGTHNFFDTTIKRQQIGLWIKGIMKMYSHHLNYHICYFVSYSFSYNMTVVHFTDMWALGFSWMPISWMLSVNNRTLYNNSIQSGV